MSEQEQRHDKAVSEEKRQQAQAVRLSKFLLFFSFLSLIALIALLTLIQKNNSNNDQVRESVQHLENFVNELEATPQEEQNEAITRAVETVPEIKAILCEEFSQASACQE